MPITTFTYSVEMGQRAAAAFGKLRGLVDGDGVPRSATEAEIKAEMWGYVKGVVNDQERATQSEAIVVPPVEDAT